MKPIRLAHVVLKTQASQFETMKAFYKTFLNATASYEHDSFSFLTYDEEHHRIAIIALPGTGPRSPTSSGLVHIAFTFANLHDLLMAYRQRKVHGMVPYWCVNHGPTTSLYYLAFFVSSLYSMLSFLLDITTTRTATISRLKWITLIPMRRRVPSWSRNCSGRTRSERTLTRRISSRGSRLARTKYRSRSVLRLVRGLSYLAYNRS